MNNTPQKIKKYWKQHPAKHCRRWKEKKCEGRLTKEHCFIYGGKQIQELWAILDLCWYHHLGKGLTKEINQWIAINQATENDFKKYPRIPWKQYKKYLNEKYGEKTP